MGKTLSGEPGEDPGEGESWCDGAARCRDLHRRQARLYQPVLATLEEVSQWGAGRARYAWLRKGVDGKL